MSSAGIIAHCLSNTPVSTEWIYDLQIGEAENVARTELVWDEVRGRFFCLITGQTGDTSQLISSPDGRPPWRVDHTFTEVTQYSSEPSGLHLTPGGRLVTSVTQGNSGGNATGQYFLYSDNLTDWFASPTLATTTSKRDYVIFTGLRYMAFGATSTTCHRTTDADLTVVESCAPPSTSGIMDGVLVYDNGGSPEKRVIITVGGDAFLGIDAKMMYTDDGGTTWNTSTYNTPDPVPEYDGSGIIFDGTIIRVYRFESSDMYWYESTDGGVSFTPSVSSSGTATNTPTYMHNIYDGLWWGVGRDSGTPATVEPQILSSATGLRTFTREDITQWPNLWPAQMNRIAHNENISIATGISSGSGTTGNGFIAYKYRL